jgi:thiol-disulfide isomerase/thioredoxin
MKKPVLISIAILFLTAITLIMTNSIFSHSPTRQLKNTLNKLNEIKTVSYSCEMTGRQAGNTMTSDTLHSFIRMYVQPDDTIVGANYAYSYKNDSTKYDGCYDGNFIVQLNWNSKTAQVDFLTNDPNRRPRAPFFIKIKSILEYALKNSDSVNVSYENLNDASKISFIFPKKQIEFFRVKPRIKSVSNKKTNYILWVNKNNIPYKLICEMPNLTTVEECTDIKASNKDLEFSSLNQIPDDFLINVPESGMKSMTLKLTELEGLLAPDWELKEVDGTSVSLKDVNSKVVLLQFSGVTCGPCHTAMPFLKQLVINNKDKNFELISLEMWSDSLPELHKFKEVNALNYRYLIGNKDLKIKYKIQGVPTFIILDQKRVIKKAILGYNKGETDKEIIETINRLL